MKYPISTSVKIEKIGIIGTGNIGFAHGVAAEKAGCSIISGAAKSEFSEKWISFQSRFPKAVFQTAEDMLQDTEIDAVIVSTPWYEIAKLLPLLFSSAKPMLIEKPLELNCAALKEVAEKPGAICSNKVVGFNRRFYQTTQELKRRIEKGGLKAVSVTISEDIDKYLRNYSSEIIPYVIEFGSVHILDLAFHLLGEIKPVQVYASHNKRGVPTASYNGLLEASQMNIPISLTLNMSDPSPVGIRCRFDDETTWVLSPLETLTVYDYYEVREPIPTDPIRRYVPHVNKKLEEPRDGKPGFSAQMEAFVQNGHAKNTAATVQEYITLLAFIDDMKATAKQPLGGNNGR